MRTGGAIQVLPPWCFVADKSWKYPLVASFTLVHNGGLDEVKREL